MTGDTITLAERMSQHLSDDQFREHVTRVAFELSLTQAQISGLLAVDAGERIIPRGTFLSLNARGLTSPISGRQVCLTAAGRHMAALLKIAGFTYPLTTEPKAETA